MAGVPAAFSDPPAGQGVGPDGVGAPSHCACTLATRMTANAMAIINNISILILHPLAISGEDIKMIVAFS
jgi:hypothetical protein